MEGLQTKIHVHNGDVTFESIQDCTPIAEFAKRKHNSGEHGSRELKHAARLPNNIVETYLNTNGITYREFCANDVHLKRMLNDPALADFRIWKGKV